MNAQSPHGSIRIATLEDAPRWLELAKARYPDRDIAGMVMWVEWCISHPDRLVLVGRASVGIAAMSLNYGVETEGRMDVLYTIPHLNPRLEAFAMIEIMMRWAKQKGARGRFKLDPDTDVDFGPFARRLGGGPAPGIRYEIPY